MRYGGFPPRLGRAPQFVKFQAADSYDRATRGQEEDDLPNSSQTPRTPGPDG
jgi:hypothetical protein